MPSQQANKALCPAACRGKPSLVIVEEDPSPAALGQPHSPRAHSVAALRDLESQGLSHLTQTPGLQKSHGDILESVRLPRCGRFGMQSHITNPAFVSPLKVEKYITFQMYVQPVKRKLPPVPSWPGSLSVLQQNKQTSWLKTTQLYPLCSRSWDSEASLAGQEPGCRCDSLGRGARWLPLQAGKPLSLSFAAS